MPHRCHVVAAALIYLCRTLANRKLGNQRSALPLFGMGALPRARHKKRIADGESEDVLARYKELRQDRVRGTPCRTRR